MTSAVLYGTTSDNELRPVRVTDSGEFVTDGGGGGDWYANLYVGGNQGDPSISLLSDGSITADGSITIATPSAGDTGITIGNTGYIDIFKTNFENFFTCNNADGRVAGIAESGDISTEGDVYAKKFIDSDGYDLGKIGQALSTIHDVIESVDDLEGLKNLFHLLLDNLKSDPVPPEPPTPPDPPTP